MSGGAQKKKTTRTARASDAAPAAPGLAPDVLSGSGQPDVESVLGALTGPRLLDLCRLFGCDVHDISGGRDRLVAKLARQMTG